MSEGKAMSRREEWLEFWEGREAPFLRALPYVLLVLCVSQVSNALEHVTSDEGLV